ncbi:MAG TPA: GNAT family N-acetyltransferase [Gemmatimonadales bacterium]|jgi:RimJ/RimL family protein N-acetyltransferase
MFELQPVLTGPLLSLRPLTAADRDALWAVAKDPLVWEQHPDQTRYVPEGFAKVFQGAMDSGGALVAVDRETGHIIGSSRYHDYDKANDVVEVGWTFLARAYWGGRYNGEMKRLMLTHAFRFVGRVWFKVGPKNLRSQRAVEKIGGLRVGTGRDGAGRESVVFELTARRFPQLVADGRFGPPPIPRTP